jgi:hypothetical protein
MGELPVGGAIDPRTFPFQVVDLHAKGATGSLKVAGPSYQKALYFRGGRVLFGSSNDPRDQLGAILIESGKITPEQLDDVSSKVGPGSPLAKVLADTGFVNQRELSEAARAKVERILSDVLAYDAGSFEFEDGVLPKGAVDLKLATERVIVAAVRRIADRNFVLRYIDGMENVLRPTADMHARTAEIETDTAGITHYLDGTRTLKEAAGLARLDEFEAAKIACALLFLGAVERVRVVDLGAIAAEAQATPPSDMPVPPPAATVETPLADTASPTFIGMEPSSTEAGTIRMDAEAPAFAAEPPAAIGLDAPIGLEPPESGSISMASADPPLVMMQPEPALTMAAEPAAEPPIAPPPPAREPQAAPAPAAGGRRVYDMPPLIPPPPKSEPIRPPAATAPPTPSELKALDELLHPRLEAPRAALERGESARAGARADAGTRATGGPRRASAGASSSKAPLLVGALAALALAAGAGWFFLVKPREAAPDARADARTAAPPATAPPEVTLPPPAPPVAADVPPATSPTAAPAAGDPRGQLQAGNLDEAGRLYADELRAAGAGAVAVQLFVACSPETIQKAVAAVGTQDLAIFPTRFNGRDCYRMAWGIHPSPQAAVRSLRALPEYFRQGGVSPKIVPAAEILP